VIRFIEHYCLIPSGAKVGQAIVLEKFQKDFIRAVYANPHPAGTRRAYLSIGRKNGKTALIACLVLAHLVGPEAKRNAQIISGALSREQAAIVYDLASKMVAQSAALRAIIREVLSSKKLIGIPLNTEYRAISAEGKTAHGLSPVLAILDELGQVRGPQSDFVDAIATSQGAHAGPLLMVISTQAPKDGDLRSLWLDDAKASQDPRIVSHLFEGAKDCALTDASAWRAANPALGKFRSLADGQEQAERAQRMPSFEPTFRNLVLNQWVEMMAPFISRSIWLLNSAEPDDRVFYEEPVYVGLDLSVKTDLTALVMISFRDKWHVKSVFWTPAKGLHERAKRDRAPYVVWESQGLIHAIPGAAVGLSASCVGGAQLTLSGQVANGRVIRRPGLCLVAGQARQGLQGGDASDLQGLAAGLQVRKVLQRLPPDGPSGQKAIRPASIGVGHHTQELLGGDARRQHHPRYARLAADRPHLIEPTLRLVMSRTAIGIGQGGARQWALELEQVHPVFWPSELAHAVEDALRQFVGRFRILRRVAGLLLKRVNQQFQNVGNVMAPAFLANLPDILLLMRKDLRGCIGAVPGQHLHTIRADTLDLLDAPVLDRMRQTSARCVLKTVVLQRSDQAGACRQAVKRSRECVVGVEQHGAGLMPQHLDQQAFDGNHVCKAHLRRRNAAPGRHQIGNRRPLIERHHSEVTCLVGHAAQTPGLAQKN
jgi:hypothetical protein